MLGTRDWEAAGHAWSGPERWLALLEALAPWLFLALVVLFFALAVARRKRYSAVSTLDLEDVERLRAAVRAAESTTVGEIGVVVLERSDEHPAAKWIAGVVFAALGSLAFAPLLPVTYPVVILGLQAVLFLLGYGLANALPDLKRRFVTEARATEVAEEQAVQEFHALGLRGTTARTGVLLFVSLFERRVIVLADEGISASVEEDVWVEADRAVLAGAKKDTLREGLLFGIALVGQVLADRFPSDGGGANEVADHVLVRRR